MTKIWETRVENQTERELKQEFGKPRLYSDLWFERIKFAVLRLEFTWVKEYGEENPDHYSKESLYVAIL